MDHSSRKNLVRAGASILVMLAISILSFSITAKEQGIWVDSGSPGCAGDTVCGDWEVDGQVTLSCCIEPKYLGTSNFEACGTVR